MWSILEGRSIYMNDLRRVGKTMILDKMKAKPPRGSDSTISGILSCARIMGQEPEPKA